MIDVFKEAPQLPEDDERLVELFRRAGRTLDDLPYTADFDRIVHALRAEGDERSEAEILHRLLNLRKAGRLRGTGQRPAPMASLTGSEEELLQELIPRYAGTMGQRDNLPYTDAFKELATEFNRCTGKNLDLHSIWRLVARVSKLPSML